MRTGKPSSKSYQWRRNSFLIGVACALMLVQASAGVATATVRESDQLSVADSVDVVSLQRMVDELRSRLGINAVVHVTVVEHDGRRLSVRRDTRGDASYALSVERGFVAGLPPAQLEAALAHELGHVWIYTHHPYLQTEQLANRVAMRAVAREHLVAVYRALWGTDAVQGSLESFLGIEATTAAQD